MRKWAFLKLFVMTFWFQTFLCSAQTLVTNSNATPLPSAAKAAFEKLKSLEGTWEAPLHGQQEGKVMVNKFHVIGDGSAVLHSEWLDGNQLTTTVFYMVGPELRADHYLTFRTSRGMLPSPLLMAVSLNSSCETLRILMRTRAISTPPLGALWMEST